MTKEVAMAEYTCSHCKNMFFVPFFEELAHFDEPCWCPYCGVAFDRIEDEEE